MQFFAQLKQITGDDLPNDFRVDAEILMDDPVAQSDDQRPLGAGSALSGIDRQTSRRLADDLQVPHNGIDGLAVREKGLLLHACSISGDPPEGFEHVLDEEAVRSRRLQYCLPPEATSSSGRSRERSPARPAVRAALPTRSQA